MSTNTEKASSRVIGVAKKLLNRPIDEASVYSKSVILTGEKEALLTENGRWCFLDALTLLSRVVGNLTVVMPSGTPLLEAEVEKFCSSAWSRGDLSVVRDGSPALLKSSSAILCVGTEAKPALPWTVINSNGWVARVSSGAMHLPIDMEQPNALGALMAASLGVTEIFKRIFDVPEDVAPLLEKTEFSLFEQTTAPTGIGPSLPSEIHLTDTLMVGAGAIGNGIALLFSQLPLRGRVHIVDKQDYADENLGTCVLTKNEGWIKQPKAPHLANWLQENSDLEVTGERELIESVKSGTGVFSKLSIDLVLNGLDDIEARRAAQDLWPSVIIDGGINEIGAAVIQYRVKQDSFACIKCWFETPKIDERKQQSQLTGLSLSSLNNMERLLTNEDIAGAEESKRDWLIERKKQGKTLCSIISEAALSANLGLNVQEGFRPSAPFIATTAAALVVAEAIKALVFPETPVVQMYQIASLFIGPSESSIKLSRHPLETCQCVVHRGAIERLCSKRKGL